MRIHIHCLTDHKPFWHFGTNSVMFVPAKECRWWERLIYKLRGFKVEVLSDEEFNADIEARKNFKNSLTYKLMEEASFDAEKWLKGKTK